MPRETVKDKIVSTATTLFYQQGYNQTGIDQVIEEAGIARGSLYYHFRSKTDLLLAYLEEFEKAWYKGLETFTQSITDPKKKLLALFDYRAQRQESKAFGGCAFIKIHDEIGSTDKKIIQKVQENKTRLKNYIRALVDQTPRSSALSADELTHMIYLLLEGGLTSTSIFRDTNELKKAKKLITKFL